MVGEELTGKKELMKFPKAAKNVNAAREHFFGKRGACWITESRAGIFTLRVMERTGIGAAWVFAGHFSTRANAEEAATYGEWEE